MRILVDASNFNESEFQRLSSHIKNILNNKQVEIHCIDPSNNNQFNEDSVDNYLTDEQIENFKWVCNNVYNENKLVHNLFFDALGKKSIKEIYPLVEEVKLVKMILSQIKEIFYLVEVERYKGSLGVIGLKRKKSDTKYFSRFAFSKGKVFFNAKIIAAIEPESNNLPSFKDIYNKYCTNKDEVAHLDGFKSDDKSYFDVCIPITEDNIDAEAIVQILNNYNFSYQFKTLDDTIDSLEDEFEDEFSDVALYEEHI